MSDFNGERQLAHATANRGKRWTLRDRPGQPTEPGEYVDLDCLGPEGARVHVHKLVLRDGQAWALGRARLPDGHPAYSNHGHPDRAMAATPVELRMHWRS